MIAIRKEYFQMRERGKGITGMKENKNGDEKLRHKRNDCLLNLNGLQSGVNYNAEFLTKNRVMAEVLKVKTLKQ
jgi:hypothetical protein